MHIDKTQPANELTPGGIIYQAGNAREFKTGDWRSMYQYGFQKSAHNVDYASLFALMTLFLLIKNVKEKILITIIARDVEFVARFALSVQ